MARIEWQVWQRNHDGERIAIYAGQGRRTGGMQGFRFEKRLGPPGEFVIEISGDDSRIDSIETDHVFEFWYRDIVAELDWTRAFSGFHRDEDYRDLEDGTMVYQSIGRSLEDILVSETIPGPAASHTSCIGGPAETPAKEHVDQTVGPGADHPRQGLTVEADGGTGKYWCKCVAYENLLDVLMDIAHTGPGDFQVEQTNPSWNETTGDIGMEFRWRTPRWGKDRRRGNTAGNKPLVFSKELGNVVEIHYRYSRLDEANVVTGIGEGYRRTRKTFRMSSGHEDDSPWARRHVVRNIQKSATDIQMQGDLIDALERGKPSELMEVTVKQTKATRWKRDWDLGDLVTTEVRGREVDQKIVGVQVGLDPDGNMTLVALMEEMDTSLGLTSTSTSTTTSTTTSTSTSTSTTSTSTTSTSVTMSYSTTQTAYTRPPTTTSTTTISSTSTTSVSLSMTMTRQPPTTSTSTTSTSTSTTTTSSSVSTTTLCP
ncbi:MAG: hypothetical protein GF350_02345 [Chitinivibrionales bacterium]|nr:hypothetical protein [Chitinivibrionales bacterium]